MLESLQFSLIIALISDVITDYCFDFQIEAALVANSVESQNDLSWKGTQSSWAGAPSRLLKAERRRMSHPCGALLQEDKTSSQVRTENAAEQVRLQSSGERGDKTQKA